MNKLIGLTVVLLVVIFLFIYVNSQKTLPVFNLTSASTTHPTIMQMKNEIVSLVIKNNKLVDGPSALQVTQGQMVILKISSDRTGIFYFHGYNRHVALQKGQTVVLSFLATMTGHFEYELENSKTILGAIDIYPQ